MKSPRSLSLAWLFGLMFVAAGADRGAAAPGDYWLKMRGLQWWEWDLDPDGDGFTSRQEYYFGTEPGSRASVPPVPEISRSGDNALLNWPSQSGVRYQLQESGALAAWQPVGPVVAGSGAPAEVNMPINGGTHFLRLEALEPADTDGDGLSGVEEGLLGTSPAAADTDGDGLGDGIEVLQTFTNPLVAEPAGGTITGTVRSDPNRDGNSADGIPLEGITVWLDNDYDGELDATEPRMVTDATGGYTFLRVPPGFYHVRELLAPGHYQTQPAEVTPSVPDSWPDEVVSYVHAATGANFPGAYGYAAERLWPGARWLLLGQTLETVDPALLLKPAGNRYEVPPVGIYNTTDMIALPDGASVTLRFSETIVDLPGNDLTIFRPVQGASSEVSEVWMGPTAADLKLYGTINQNSGGGVLGLDLANSPVRPPVRFVKLVSRTSAGVDQGAAFTALQAVHSTGAATDARVVTIVATETVSGVDFARFFQDQPPVLTLEDGGAALRAGVAVTLRMSVLDDTGVTARSLTANGQPVTLAADGTFTLTPALPGVMDLNGSATDEGGQTETGTWRLYVANADGTPAFDPRSLGTAGDDGAPDLRVHAPAAGAVVNAATPIVATVGGASPPAWEVAYAPVDLVNPYDLEAVDADYQILASATGYRTNEAVATFPGNSVPNGIYFLRLRATPTGGGATRYFGQVIAKGVDAASLQPRISLTSPADGAAAGLVQDVSGSIESDRPLTEWYVDVAPRDAVDLNDLGGNEPAWRRLASGTAVVSPAARLARLDTSVLPNGSYVLRVVAWNDLRLGRVEARVVEVSGENKLGRHRREFTDVEISLAGFPLTVKRVFDSFNSGSEGDFGYGWSLALVNPEIGETVPRTGSGIFGQTAYRDGTRVYITGPDGRRSGFTFHPVLVSTGYITANYRASFTPDPGVYDRLEIPGGSTPFLTVTPSGDVKLNFPQVAWNPDTFILVRPDGTRYTYHESRGFLEAVDLSGNRLTYSAAGFKHSGGMSLAFTRDAQGRITGVNAGGGRQWTYAYSPAGDLISVTDPDGRAATYGYLSNPAHYLSTVTDPFGRVGSTYEYGPDGRLLAVVDAAGHRTLQSWDPLGFTGSVTDGRGKVTQLTYDQRGNVLTATDPLGGVTRYAYGDARHPDKATAVTDPLNRVTTTAYDAAGNVVSVIRPGNVFAWQTLTWNDRNQMLSSQRSDMGGFVERWEYDTDGRMTRSAAYGEPVSTFAYTPQGQLASQTAGGSTLNIAYDSATGLAREVTDSGGFRITLTRNASGQVTGTSTASGETVTAVPGSDGLPLTLTDSTSASAGTVRQPDGSITINDWNGRNSRVYLDGSGRVTGLRGQDGYTSIPELDANNNVVAVTGPLNTRYTMDYDDLNRPREFTDPAGRKRTYVHDAAGRLTEMTDRNGRKKRFTYNLLDQPVKEEWLDNGGTVLRTFTYTYATNLNYGRLDAVSDGQATWTFQGGAARPTRIITAYPGQAQFSVSYSWTDNGGSLPEMVRLANGSGTAIFHTITSQIIGGRVYRHTWDASALTGGTSRHVRHYFDAMGSEVRTERFASVFSADINQAPFAITKVDRDRRGRSVRIRHTTAADALLFPQSDMTLTRTPGGCITSITEPGNTAAVSYDAGLQIAAVTNSGRPSEGYTYDAAGNRLTSHFQADPAVVGTANRITSVGGLTLEHDFEGNLIRETNTATGAIREFAYDHNNQMVLAQTRPSAGDAPVEVARYQYDFAGNMMARTEGGTTTWVIYDRGMPLGEFRSGETTPRRLFFYDVGRLDRWFASWDLEDGERWYLQDQRNSVRGVIRKDATPVTWADYDSFGRLISGDAALLGTLRYTGRFWSDAISLYDYRARHYSPEWGRFLQEDPSLFEAGDLNLYRYVRNDALNMTDPTGRTAAIEYVLVVCLVSLRAYSEGDEIGRCVAEMIGSAALGLYGVQGGNGAACAIQYIGKPIQNAIAYVNSTVQYIQSWGSVQAWKNWAWGQVYSKGMEAVFGVAPKDKIECDDLKNPVGAAKGLIVNAIGQAGLSAAGLPSPP